MNKRFFIFLCAAFIATSVNAEQLKILSYQANPIAVLTEQGELIELTATDNLPKPAVMVEQVNEPLELVKIKNKEGKYIWLDAFDVELNKGKVIHLPCAVVAMNQAHDKAQKGTQGFGAGCNK